MALPAGTALAHDNDSNAFVQTNLISDLPNVGAQVVDPDAQNTWGLAFNPAGGTPLWVANNNSGTATIYSVNVGGTTASKAKLTVTLPGGRAATNDGPSPTGQVFNPTTGFNVTGTVNGKTVTGPALFIFDSEAGQITGWNPTVDGTGATVMPGATPTAVYKGLAIATTKHGTFLYASNFHDGTVDVFDSNFHHVFLRGHFRDPFLPKGYAPFGIQEINGFLYVTYAVQNATKHDDVAGHGHGLVDIFSNNGFFLKRLVTGGDLNSPWGLALAPAGFGPFGGQLLVGNFGDGLIHAYGPISGFPRGALLNTKHQPIQIDGLWALTFGSPTTGGTGTLLFSSGPNGEVDGLVGSINPGM